PELHPGRDRAPLRGAGRLGSYRAPPEEVGRMKKGIQRVDFRNYHRYKIDGRWATGVTTALNGVPKDEAVKRGAARLVAEYAVTNYGLVGRMIDESGEAHTRHYLAEIPNARRDSAAIRGTEVHALAEKYIRGEEVEVPDRLLPYV